MLPADFKMISAAALRAFVYLNRFEYAKLSKTPPCWVTQHIVHSFFFFLPLPLFEYLCAPFLPLSSPSSSAQSPLFPSLPLILIELKQPMPWSLWWCVMIDGGWRNRRQGTFIPSAAWISSCQNPDVSIQLQTHWIFIRNFISTHFSSLSLLLVPGRSTRNSKDESKGEWQWRIRDKDEVENKRCRRLLFQAHNVAYTYTFFYLYLDFLQLTSLQSSLSFLFTINYKCSLKSSLKEWKSNGGNSLSFAKKRGEQKGK